MNQNTALPSARHTAKVITGAAGPAVVPRWRSAIRAQVAQIARTAEISNSTKRNHRALSGEWNTAENHARRESAGLTQMNLIAAHTINGTTSRMALRAT